MVSPELVALIAIAAFEAFVGLPVFGLARQARLPHAWLGLLPVLCMAPIHRLKDDYRTELDLLEVVALLVLFLIPGVSLFAWAWAWGCISEKMGRPVWLGWIAGVPVVGWVVPPILFCLGPAAPSPSHPRQRALAVDVTRDPLSPPPARVSRDPVRPLSAPFSRDPFTPLPARMTLPVSEISRDDPMPWRAGLKRKMDYECAPAEGRCWLDQHVPRLGLFDDCFPGKIGLGDVDGLVERNGCMLMLELKQPGAHLRGGQRIAYEQLSRRLGPAYQPLVIWGAPDFSGPLQWQTWKQGRSDGPRSTTLADIRQHFRSWFAWADRQR